MDKILYNEVEKFVDSAKLNADKILLKKHKKIARQDIENALEEATEYSGVLHAFQKSYIEGAKDLSIIKESLKEFVARLTELNVLLLQKQDETIQFTDDAIDNKDTEIYLLNPIYKANFTTSNEKEYLLKLSQAVNFNKTIEKLIEKTDERITKAFDEFTDKNTADAIINREFNHTLTYLDTLNTVRKMRYTDMDNLMPITTTINAVIYEAMQLAVVLERVQRFLKNYKQDFAQEFAPYYIMMDGVDSKSRLAEQGKAYVDNLLNATDILNSVLKDKQSEIDLVCNFVTYKQDEIHGVINGNIERFIDIAKEVYKGVELKLVYSQGQINSKEYPNSKPLENVEESVKGIPFDLYGNACYYCRAKMNDPKQQIILKNGEAYTFNDLAKNSPITKNNNQQEQ